MGKYLKNQQYGNVRVENREKGMWAVLDDAGNEIVPFGKYSWIDWFRSRIGSNCWTICQTGDLKVLETSYMFRL